MHKSVLKKKHEIRQKKAMETTNCKDLFSVSGCGFLYE